MSGTARAYNLSAVPDSLTELDQWVLWKYIERDGRPTKVPFRVSGKTADSTDPEAWASFEAVTEAARDSKYAGIGFVFSPFDPYCGIDLDDSLDENGQFKAWAQPIVLRFADTYMETSPSGTGVKIWIKGRMPEGRGVKAPYQDGAIEAYDRGRFFTVTGRISPGAPPQIEEHQSDLEWLLSLVRPTAAAPKKKADLRTIRKLEAGERHNALMSIAAQYRARGMEAVEIAAALKAVNQERCHPPKSDKELRGIVEWVCQKPAGTSVPQLASVQQQPTPITTATAPEPSVENWRDYLILTSQGTVKPVLANATTALRFSPAWQGVLGWDDFALEPVALKPTPWGHIGRWTDHEDRAATEWLQREGIFIAPATTADAVQHVARDRRFHPVRTYLDSLTWDGVQRIDQWLALYLGAENDEYSRAVGPRWLISAVARIFEPGCKADSCLILEGEQGIRKSTALRTLSEPWFTDEIADLGSKDAAMQCAGVWVIELGELDGIHRGDVSRIKAFMSRTVDRFRPSYGRRVEPFPRQCVFAGSVNLQAWNRDETGGRRFWPVVCTGIRIEELARDRHQLWAEAVVRYRAGSPWWIDDKRLAQLAAEEQSSRYDRDPWEELIIEWLEDPIIRRDDRGSPVGDMTSRAGSVTIEDILTHCIGKRQDLWTKIDKNRVGSCLRSLGWEWYQERDELDRRRSKYRPKPQK